LKSGELLVVRIHGRLGLRSFRWCVRLVGVNLSFVRSSSSEVHSLTKESSGRGTLDLVEMAFNLLGATRDSSVACPAVAIGSG
jgi:hypothetical protein